MNDLKRKRDYGEGLSAWNDFNHEDKRLNGLSHFEKLPYEIAGCIFSSLTDQELLTMSEVSKTCATRLVENNVWRERLSKFDRDISWSYSEGSFDPSRTDFCLTTLFLNLFDATAEFKYLETQEEKNALEEKLSAIFKKILNDLPSFSYAFSKHIDGLREREVSLDEEFEIELNKASDSIHGGDRLLLALHTVKSLSFETMNEYYNLFDAAIKRSATMASLVALRAFLKEDVQFGDGIINLCLASAEKGDERALRLLLLLAPSIAQVLYEQNYSYFSIFETLSKESYDAQDFEKAAEFFEEGLNRCGKDVEAEFLYFGAKIYVHLQNFTRVEALLKRAFLEYGDTLPLQFFFKAGLNYRDMCKYPDAIAKFKEGMDLCEDEIPTKLFELMARTYADDNNFIEAIKYYEAVYSSYTEESPPVHILNCMADIYHFLKDDEKAAAFYEKTLIAHGPTPPTSFLLEAASFYMETRNFEKAATLYDQAISLLGVTASHLQLVEAGLAFYESKNYPKAIELLERSISITRENTESHIFSNLGCAYYELKEPQYRQKAAIYFELAIQNSKSEIHPKIYVNAAKTNYSMGNYQKAAEYFDRVIESTGGILKPYAFVIASFSNERLGNLEKAADLLENAILLYGSSVNSKYLHKSAANFLTLKQFEKSAKYFDQLIEKLEGKVSKETYLSAAFAHSQLGNKERAGFYSQEAEGLSKIS